MNSPPQLLHNEALLHNQALRQPPRRSVQPALLPHRRTESRSTLSGLDDGPLLPKEFLHPVEPPDSNI